MFLQTNISSDTKIVQKSGMAKQSIKKTLKQSKKSKKTHVYSYFFVY